LPFIERSSLLVAGAEGALPPALGPLPVVHRRPPDRAAADTVPPKKIKSWPGLPNRCEKILHSLWPGGAAKKILHRAWPAPLAARPP